MHRRIIKFAPLAVALALSAGLSHAANKNKEAVESIMGGIEPMVKEYASSRKPAKVPLAKRLDINTASKAGLMKLPGIYAEEADSIIANRPYLTKSGLVTKKALPMGVYQGIRQLVIAKQK